MTTPLPPSLRLEPLTPARLPDLLAFFEQRAFADKPEWRSCYCAYPHVDHTVVVWKERSAAQNRDSTCANVAAGTMEGWLALDEAGRVVGWCNASPKRSVRGLFDGEAAPDEARTGAVVCFVVERGWRRRGVASALLAAACDGFAARGFAFAEGYPIEGAASDAANHHGTPAMYAAAGFAQVARDDGGRVTMRKPLGAESKA